MEDDKEYPRQNEKKYVGGIDFSDFQSVPLCGVLVITLDDLCQFIKDNAPKVEYDFFVVCSERDDSGYYNALAFYKMVPESDSKYFRRIAHRKKQIADREISLSRYQKQIEKTVMDYIKENPERAIKLYKMVSDAKK